MGLEVRWIFLDISKAFDKVDGLIFTLRQNGICGKMINILEDFVSDRKQRFVLIGQSLSWVDIRAGVPRGSTLGPLLFLINFNYLSNDIKSKYELFVDETSLFPVVINLDLEKTSEWTFQYGKSSLTQLPPNRFKK